MNKVAAGACWGFVLAYSLALPASIGLLFVILAVGAGFIAIRTRRKEES